ncbi:hypothetical protein X798_02480 [Onchocerca flexuosa]|uniref:C2H2-type domain-containing protein n=3 Tax=Onchocerca flexuosa TaxID=387005 RepID=A0A238BYT0_9BILA|nr:hypothetical protein X798_02480 [Onchocerca flexuosa]
MSDECCYVCNECPNSYATLNDLERHMEQMHAGIFRSDTITTNVTATLRLPKSETDEDDGQYCLKNGTDNQKIDTMEHDGESGGNSPSSSDLSNFDGIMDSVNYNLDESTNAEGCKTFGCRFCPKLFHERSQLNIHYKHTHRDKPQYECDECHVIFAIKRELSTHMRIHSGEQPHTCTQCGKQFGTRQLLKKHWMWHTGERSHVCPHCGKAFFQKGHLTQHLMIHAGGRPHQCPLCHKTFIFKFDLNRHMKIHAERGFSCDKCGRSFLKQLQLDEHILKCKGATGVRSQPITRTSTPMTDAGNGTGNNSINAKSELRPSTQSSPGRRQSISVQQQRQQQYQQRQRQQQQQHHHHHYQQQQQQHPQQKQHQQRQLASNVATTLSPVFSAEEMSKVAQVLAVQQQQRALVAAAAAHHSAAAHAVVANPLLQASALQNFAQNLMANGANNQQPAGQTFFCIFCMKHFNTQASFTLHLSFVHFRNNVVNVSMQNCFQEHFDKEGKVNTSIASLPSIFGTVANAKGISEDAITHSDTTTNSSCSSSPQKVSPGVIQGRTQSPAQLSEADHLSDDSESPDISIQKGCEQCETHRQRVAELEQTLEAKRIELKNTRELMRRIGVIAGSLLESCTDFDKQWVTHSRKVYSQIQSVICNME